MTNSRTRNSIYNFVVTLVAGFVLPLIGLVKYSLFIRTYGPEINGIQITMESFIAILNIFEICFSLAFRQLLFKPLANDDKDEVNRIYSRGVSIFRLTGTLFLTIGLIVAFVFPYFSKSPFNYFQTVIYFIILVIPYGISYFLMGPNLVLTADQKEYKINIWIQTIAILRMVFMIVIIILKLPVVFIFIIESLNILVANTIARNISLKHYPWLKVIKEKIGGFKELVSNIKYTFIQRLEVISTTNIDTFVISVFISYTGASIYGAYNYIIDNISKIINKALETTLNSFGNLFNSDSNNTYEVFLEFFEFVSFIASIIAICVCLFFNEFFTIWVGNSGVEFTASRFVLIVLSFNIYYMILRESYIIGRDANGLFSRASGNAVIYVVLKLILSVVMIYKLGIPGAIISTALVNILVDFTYNPRLLCDSLFKNQTKDFYFKLLVRTVLTVVCGIVIYNIKEVLFGGWTISYLHFGISALVIGSICVIIMTVLYTLMFKSFRLFFKRILNSILRKG